MNQQVFLLHGGETFNTYEEYLVWLRGMEVDTESLGRKDWKRALVERLGLGYEVLLPSMPNKQNAKYLEWKIMFEKWLPFLRDGVVLIGHSLGGLFLAKYLSEEKFPRRIAATILVAAPYSVRGKEALADFVLGDDLTMIERQGGHVTLYHSSDDTVVPFSHAERYAQALPGATLRLLSGRDHFTDEDFPELMELVQNTGVPAA